MSGVHDDPSMATARALIALRDKNRELRASLEAAEAENAQLKQSIKTIVKEDGVVVSRQAREIARLREERDAAGMEAGSNSLTIMRQQREIVDLEARCARLQRALACDHHETAWTFVQYEGATWNRCVDCGLMERWANGTRFDQRVVSGESLAGPGEGDRVIDERCICGDLEPAHTRIHCPVHGLFAGLTREQLRERAERAETELATATTTAELAIRQLEAAETEAARLRELWSEDANMLRAERDAAEARCARLQQALARELETLRLAVGLFAPHGGDSSRTGDYYAAAQIMESVRRLEALAGPDKPADSQPEDGTA